MKTLVLFLVLVFAAMSLSASDIDGALKTIFTYCSVIEHEGDQVLMTQSFFEDEGAAYAWVANCAHVVLAIRAGWEDCPAAYSSKVRSLDAIAAVWQTPYQTFVVSIPVWEILENFNDESNLELDSGEFVSDILRYVDYYGDVSPLSMY
ncbi:MAG: hypothetical protein U1B83_10540 [Candidatus Cloacimonadaceae bacterium]|nr:hypothetical protein [Candidatus Cloacimonadaceae bacterium]